METVTVSQAPTVSEVPTPAAGGAALAALPSAVQDLARFFLSLSGSSSLGSAGGVAGVAAPAAGVGVQLCPSTFAGGAVALGAATTIPAGVSDPPSAPAAVPGVSGRQQHQEDSRPNRCRRRPAMGPTGDQRSGQGGGLLPLVLLAVGSGTIAYLLRKMTEQRLLLPKLDVRLEVLLVIFALLRQVGRRGRLHEFSTIARVLVVDPPRLRVGRMSFAAKGEKKSSIRIKDKQIPHTVLLKLSPKLTPTPLSKVLN